MAKFQLCKFRRTKDSNWEKGAAILRVDFGYSDIKGIIDEAGDPIKELWDFRLLIGYAHTTIDTNTSAWHLD